MKHFPIYFSLGYKAGKINLKPCIKTKGIVKIRAKSAANDKGKNTGAVACVAIKGLVTVLVTGYKKNLNNSLEKYKFIQKISEKKLRI